LTAAWWKSPAPKSRQILGDFEGCLASRAVEREGERDQ
jgi:hypothetical protein